jgi:hypothetical protein
VTLDPAVGSLEIVDHLESAAAHEVKMAFHLGPAIEAVLTGCRAHLHWRDAEGGIVTCVVELPSALHWSLYRGSTEPILGWYSPAFGRKTPAFALIGCGELSESTLTTALHIFG